MRKVISITVTIILSVILFSACSNQDDLGVPHKVYVNVLFTPESFCEIGYNDITLEAIETLSHKYGYEYSFCVPESIEKGMDYYRKWCEATLNDDVSCCLFVFTSNLYEALLAQAPHPAADSRKDILIFEVEQEIPYAYSFDMTFYGAAYMIGSYYLQFLPVNIQIIAGNPHMEGLSAVTDAFKAATEDMACGTVSLSYISESPDGGFDDDDRAFLTCQIAYLLHKDETNVFIPYAGLSNLGVYRFSQSNYQLVVGVDCIDPDAFFFTYLSMNKKMDLALDDFLQRWIKGDEIPRHTLYTLESRRVVVDKDSSLESESALLDSLFEQAIAKEKEYLNTNSR